jgi:2-dehydro-3-deoxygalactonokinase
MHNLGVTGSETPSPSNSAETALIAVDWGTTSLRAWRLDRTGQVAERRRGPLGIMQVSDGAFSGALQSLIGDWFDATEAPVLMAGMIGSRQGWVEAPYAPCPAGLASIAQQLVAVPEQPRIRIVPGICIRGSGAPDVARGEETQILGLDGAGPTLAILPGTHSKWAWIEDGEIQWFTTFLTGELYGALRHHSILGRLMEDREQSGEVPDGFTAGLDDVMAEDGPGPLQALFAARTRGLFGDLQGHQLPGYLSGILIGSEINEALRAIRRDAEVPRAASLIGADTLVPLYANALKRAGIATYLAGEECSARGLFRVAQAAGLIGSSR